MWLKGPKRPVPLILHVVVLTAVLLALAAVMASTLTFFTVDTAIRFLQVRELIAHQWQTVAIDYPAHSVDPDFRHVPYYYAYSLVDEQLYLNISPFFPLVASLLYALLGKIGLAIVPVLGGVLSAVALYRIARLSQLPHARLLLWATVFATPLLFYSLQLWDHSIGTGLALWGVYAIAKGIKSDRWQPLLWAGILVSLAMGQRPELYVLALAVAAGLLLVTFPRWRPILALFAGGVTGIVPLWLLQYFWVGHPLGMALAPNLLGYGIPDAYPFVLFDTSRAFKISRFLLYVEARDLLTFAAFLLTALGMAIIIFTLRLALWQKRVWWGTGFLMAAVGYLLLLVKGWGTPLTGVLSTFPLIAFSLAYVAAGNGRHPRHSIYRFIFSTALLFLALIVLFWPSYGGEQQWGTRYLLPLYPLLLYLAFYAYSAYGAQMQPALRKNLRITAAVLLLLSVLLQTVSVRLLYATHQENAAVRDFVAGLSPAVVLTNHPFLPADMSALDEKIFLYVDDKEDIENLIPRFWEQGIDRLAILPLQPLDPPRQVGNISVVEASSWVYELEFVDEQQ